MEHTHGKVWVGLHAPCTHVHTQQQYKVQRQNPCDLNFPSIWERTTYLATESDGSEELVTISLIVHAEMGQ